MNDSKYLLDDVDFGQEDNTGCLCDERVFLPLPCYGKIEQLRDELYKVKVDAYPCEATNPSHYDIGGTQPIDLIFSLGFGLEFCQGNIIKYASRLGKKGNDETFVADLKKIQQYAQFILNWHRGDDPRGG